MKILRRKEAISNGELYYFTGIPCLRGHISKRITSNRACYECALIIKYQQDIKRADKIKIYNRTTKRKEYMKKWYLKNRKRILKQQKVYDQTRRNKASVAAKSMRRYATKLNATPKWSERKQILEFYKGCPDGHQVDHIVPLKHSKVSGLHVLANLQYLTISQNCQKSNTFTIPD